MGRVENIVSNSNFIVACVSFAWELVYRTFALKQMLFQSRSLAVALSLALQFLIGANMSHMHK
jgi:hypothetical protein